MLARVDALVWKDDAQVPVVLEIERSDDNEISIKSIWPDYLSSENAVMWLTDVDAAGLVGALAAIVGGADV